MQNGVMPSVKLQPGARSVGVAQSATSRRKPLHLAGDPQTLSEGLAAP
jgi:hypothetical protein